MPEDVAIFALRQDGSSLSIDPVVIVHYGADQKFKVIPSLNPALPSSGATAANFEKIESTFYQPGTSVSVFSGGQKLGTAAVTSSNIEGADGGCVDLSATISYSGVNKPLLAANTNSEIPGHASTRRAATAAERSILRHLAEQWFLDYGLDRQVVQRARMGNVVFTQLRKSAGGSMIGRLDVTTKKALFRLFAVAEMDQGRYRLTLANLETQKDLEDGNDKTAREYVDQLDIDNDGVDEIITTATHYESWSYDVWSFDAKQGAWRHSFQSVAGGC